MIRARFKDGFTILLPMGSEILEDLSFRPELVRHVQEQRRKYELQVLLWGPWEWV